MSLMIEKKCPTQGLTNYEVWSLDVLCVSTEGQLEVKNMNEKIFFIGYEIYHKYCHILQHILQQRILNESIHVPDLFSAVTQFHCEHKKVISKLMEEFVRA